MTIEVLRPPCRRQRLPDWRDRLSALIARRLRLGFEWGVRDCCLWAADACVAVTGIDYADGIRGTYDDARSACLVLRAIGGLRGAAARGGVLLTSPAFAVEGDVGLARFNGRPMLAVAAGGVWLIQATTALHAIGAECVHAAWGVGHA